MKKILAIATAPETMDSLIEQFSNDPGMSLEIVGTYDDAVDLLNSTDYNHLIDTMNHPTGFGIEILCADKGVQFHSM